MLVRSSPRLLILALAACGASAPHPPYVQQRTSALAPIPLSPPPGRVEVIPPRPQGADAWVDGEWVRKHDRWVWLVGRWVEVPRGSKYAPWVTVRGADGTLYYAPSVWVDDAGAPMDPPRAVALARASREAVFTAGGEVAPIGRNIESAPSGDAGPTDAASADGPAAAAR